MSDPRPAVASWFASRKLGLFVHFGLYALEGWHEQDHMRRRIPRATYRKLIDRFNPTRFDAEQLLDLAESAGMQYICFTTKHHDGFCLWDTKQTQYQVMNAPCGRDLVGELAAACHRRRFPLGLYYSIADWHQPNYPNRGRHHELPEPGDGDEPDWDRYMAYLVAQARELCSNYGPVAHWFWDINVPEHRDPGINQMLRELQPDIVINDRGFDEGDFGTPEREYSDALEKRAPRFDRPTEACNSVGTQSWGYRCDEDYYATVHLTNSITRTLARGGHYLLNVGPDARGEVPAQAAAVVGEVGDWYQRVREAFGDAEPASDLTRNPQVLLTRRGRTLYAHLPAPVLAEAVVLPPLAIMPVKATLLNTGQPLRASLDPLPAYWQSQSAWLTIKGLPRDRLATEPLIVRLDFDQPLPHAAASVARAFEG